MTTGRVPATSIVVAGVTIGWILASVLAPARLVAERIPEECKHQGCWVLACAFDPGLNCYGNGEMCVTRICN